MGEIKKINGTAVNDEIIEDYLFTSETKLNEKQKAMFIKLAQLHNLNPFKREIYPIPYGKEFSIVTGYQIYIQRAEATGDLDGWEVESNEETAKITIWRKSFAHPFTWEVDKSDFGKSYGSWKSMPKFMLKKVAIGQGFRLAFPNELGSMPYLKEEMEGAEPFAKKTTKRTVIKEAPTEKNGAYYETLFAKCKTRDEVVTAYNGLPEAERHKGTLAYKEAEARGEFLKQQSELNTDKIEDAEFEELPKKTDLINHMIEEIKEDDEDYFTKLDNVIDKVKESNKKREYLSFYKDRLTKIGAKHEPNVLPF